MWSLGHRNVQGLGWADDGRMFASEFGQNTWDELNLIEPGGNYGWPEVEGVEGDDGFVDPVATWGTDDASPERARGHRRRRLPRRPAGRTTAGASRSPRTASDARRAARGASSAACVRSRCAPDGSLWVLTNNTDGRGDPRAGDDRILRVAIG